MFFKIQPEKLEHFLSERPFGKLIAFAGPSGVGKDTAAWLLTNKMPGNFQKFSFASRLKKICSQMSNLPVSRFSDPVKKNTQDDFLGVTPKELAQFMGTEILRNQFHPDIHLIWMHEDRLDSVWDLHVITDLRFQNEYDYVQAQGGTVIQLYRDVPARGIPGHVSDKIDFNRKPGDKYHAIENNGTMHDLELALSRVITL
jgi:DNA polymerase III delta prime subunit